MSRTITSPVLHKAANDPCAWVDNHLSAVEIARLQAEQTERQRSANARRLSDWQYRRAQVAHARRLPPEARLAALLVDPSDSPVPQLPRSMQVGIWIDLAIVATAVGLVVLGMNLIML